MGQRVRIDRELRINLIRRHKKIGETAVIRSRPLVRHAH